MAGTAVWFIYMITAASQPLMLPGHYATRDACVAVSARNNATLGAAGIAGITLCMEGRR